MANHQDATLPRRLRIWAEECRALLGIERSTTSHGDKLVSATGAALAVAMVYAITAWYLEDTFSQVLVISSMGASAVLLFAVPHGALSQPWSVIAGHLLSALIGVSCARLIPQPVLAGALAVGLSVLVMTYLRCIHPPGGATALTAVLGGADIHALGFGFILFPVGFNLLLMLFAALGYNALFPWRRYPVHLALRPGRTPAPAAATREHELTQEDFSAAMRDLDAYFDITAEGLTELLERAKQHAERNLEHPDNIEPGHFYSNGKLGRGWSIRQIVDANDTPGRSHDQVIYKTVAGDGSWHTGVCERSEFRQWARFEVVPEQGHWVKTE